MSEAAKKNSLGIKRDEESGEYTFDAREALNSMGGVVGLIETTIPAAAYVAVFLFTKSVLISVLIAGSLSIASLIAQILRKRSVVQALAGAVGIAVAVYLPLSNPSQPASYFVPGFFTNVGYGSVILLSILVRRPIIGLIVSLFNSTAKSWHKDPAARRRYTYASAIWVLLFGGRLAVQLPFYFSGNLLALGIAREVMGIPLYALCMWFTWLLVRSQITKPANGNFESDSRN